MPPHGTGSRPDSLVSTSNLKHDLLPSIVVFLVALPLCMGIAIASGVPVAAGLVTGIVGGIVVGLLAGSPLQVSGPAAGLTVIVVAIVHQVGLHALGLVVLVAGGLQLVAGLARLGQWFRAVSPAVIHGMLAGIGVLIVIGQFHVMVDEKPRTSGLKNLAAIPESVAKGLPLPTVRSTEDRRFRRDTMQDLGGLLAIQRQLQEDVTEAVAAPAAAESFAVLAGRQERLQARLATLVARMSEHGLLGGDDPKAAALSATTAVALDRSREALQALRQRNTEGASRAQIAAAGAIEGIQDALKNRPWAARLGVLTIVLIVVWQRLVPRRLRLVPAPLVAITLATAAAALLYLPVQYVGVPENLFDDLHVLSASVLGQAPWWAILQAGFIVAAVASAETLLCATAVDQMHRGPRTKYDRELCAQGVGNMICGVLGALPMTGVIVRSAANVQSGARSRMSAVLHGVWLLVFVVFLAHVVRMIPTASLAAMLVYTGYKLVNPKHIATLWRHGKGEVLVYAATLMTIVASDLLTGVLVGIALAACKLLLTFSRLDVQLSIEPDANTAVLRLKGAATFLRLPRLAVALEEVPPAAEVRVELDELDYIDHACLELLTSWGRQYESVGGTLYIDWDALQARFRGAAPPSPAKRASLAA